jgi:protein-disulfide isomerase
MWMQKFLAANLVALVLVGSALLLDTGGARAEANDAQQRRQLAEATGGYIAPPQQPQQKTDISLVIDEHRQQIYDDPAAPVVGNPQGSTTLVMFFDYRCPYCKKVAPIIEQLVRTDPQVRVIYKELPILGATSLVAAKAALAAERQGKYVDFHHAMMETRGRISQDTVMSVASRVGLDTVRLARDMADPEISAAIQRNKELAALLHIHGTPAYVVNNRVERGTGDLQDFRELVSNVAVAD